MGICIRLCRYLKCIAFAHWNLISCHASLSWPSYLDHAWCPQWCHGMTESQKDLFGVGTYIVRPLWCSVFQSSVLNGTWATWGWWYLIYIYSQVICYCLFQCVWSLICFKHCLKIRSFLIGQSYTTDCRHSQTLDRMRLKYHYHRWGIV